MMNKKLVSCVTLLIASVSFLHAQVEGTLVSSFELKPSELRGTIKTFVNKSNRDLLVRWKIQEDVGWQIREKGTVRFYSQEPILKKNSSIRIDLAVGFKQLLKDSKGDEKYEFSLELLQVKKIPKVPGEILKTSKLKKSEYALQINKNKFLTHDVITFIRNKNGLLICESSGTASA